MTENKIICTIVIVWLLVVVCLAYVQNENIKSCAIKGGMYMKGICWDTDGVIGDWRE